MRLLRGLICIAYICATGFAPAWGQSEVPVSLVADTIRYEPGGRVLIASGNVEIFYKNQKLTATRLIFDQDEDTIVAEGPLRLTDGENYVVIADFAELSPDLREGLLRGARTILNEQFQLSSVELRRSEGRYNELLTTVATTCKICDHSSIPTWQIRARRVIHDQEEKRLYFENAQLRLMGVPVAYLPHLRIPDPSVKRATGFLVPQLVSSNTLGTGVKIPYFLTIGDHADLKLTPFITNKGVATLQMEFRRRFRNGEFNVEGALSVNDGLTANPARAYIFADGFLTFGNGFTATFDVEMTSDDGYLLQYGFSGKDRLDSSIGLERTRRHNFVSGNVVAYQTLRTTVANSTIPSFIGDVYARYRWPEGVFGGNAGLTIETGGLIRTSSVDVTGRDMLRVSVQGDWQRTWAMESGVLFNVVTEMHGDIYKISDDATYADLILRGTPIVGADLRFPLAKTGARGALHIIEPVAQLVWSPSNGTAVPNEDSVQVEFEETNLFSLNRFAGSDVHEWGLRANVGFSYTRYDPSGWNFGFTIGRVFRANDLGQFTAASGLAGETSDYVSAVKFSLPPQLTVVNRTLFDDTFAMAKNETTLNYATEKMSLDTTYVWLEQDLFAGATQNRSEWSFDASYDFRRHWNATANWRYDFVSSSPIATGLVLTYRNECIKVDLSASRRFTSTTNVTPSSDIGLTVTLEGLGSRGGSDKYARSCAI